MQAGKLRHRITLRQPNDSQETAFGEVTPGQALQILRWGSIEPLSGRELWQAQQVQADVTHRIRMRYVAGVTPKWSLVYSGRVFQILSATCPDERRRELEILAREQV